MKKKILSVVMTLVLLLSLGLVIAMPVLAATIDLAVNDENPWTDGAFMFENISPGGDPMKFNFKLHNVGDLPGVLTFSMSVEENDMAGAPAPNMSADEFASLIYVEAVSYQYIWLDDPEGPYTGSVNDDLDSWLGMDAIGNNDGKVSLYEISQIPAIPYGDYVGDQLEAGAEITYFIDFQLGNSLVPFEAGGAIQTGVEDNSLQGDGVSVTITATLESDIEQSSGNVFQAAGVAGPVLNDTTDVTYGTIQDAIDDADLGEIISVSAGTYDEQIVIDKSLTLQGAGNTTVIQPSGPELMATTSIPWIGTTHTMSAIVSVETVGGEVTIQDLEIDGSLITSKSTTWVAGLVYLETSGKVEGVVVNGGSTLPDRTAGIFAVAITEPVSLEVTGCTVEVYTRAGIYALGGTITANYHHNEINGPGDTEAGVPNGMFFLEGAKGSATYNVITDLSYTGETYLSTGIGTYNAGSNILFAYNDISSVQNAFALSNNTSGTIIEYNVVYDCQTGVRIESGATNSIIRHNSIKDNDYAIRCDEAMGSGNEAHFNSFANNTGMGREGYEGAVCNLYPTALDATNNYWGHSSGPCGVGSGSGDSVSTNVDFEPWLLAEGGDPYDRTLSLPVGWSLISPDKALSSHNFADVEILYEYDGGFVTPPVSAFTPLDAVYAKTLSGGGVGFNYAVGEAPAMYSKELSAGWNLMSVPDMVAETYAILAHLRYVTIGTQQGIGLTTLASQEVYNLSGDGFYEATLTDDDWDGIPELLPFDGCWAYMEADKTFEVIPD